MRKGPETGIPEGATIFEGEAKKGKASLEEMGVAVGRFVDTMHSGETDHFKAALAAAKEEGKPEELEAMYAEATKPENLARTFEYHTMLHKLAELHGSDIRKIQEEYATSSWDLLIQEYQGARDEMASRKRESIREFIQADSLLTSQKLLKPEQIDMGDGEQVSALQGRNDKVKELELNLDKLSADELDREYPWAMREYTALARRLSTQARERSSR